MHLPAVLQSEAGALTHRIKHLSVGIQGPCTQRIPFIDLLMTPTSAFFMEQRNREERRALEGERKGAMRKDGGKRLAGFTPLLLSTLLLPAWPSMGKSSHLELRQGMLWKNVSIRVTHICPISPQIKPLEHSEPQRDTGARSVSSQGFGASCLTSSG